MQNFCRNAIRSAWSEAVLDTFARNLPTEGVRQNRNSLEVVQEVIRNDHGQRLLAACHS